MAKRRIEWKKSSSMLIDKERKKILDLIKEGNFDKAHLRIDDCIALLYKYCFNLFIL